MYRYWTFGLDLFLPVAEVTLGVVLDDDIVFIDDTGMPVLDKSKPGGKFRGHLWAFKGSTSKMVAFKFTESWEATEIQAWVEAIELGDERAGPAVEYIRKVYEVEARAKRLGLDAADASRCARKNRCRCSPPFSNGSSR